MTLFHQTSYGSREDGNDWTGNSVYLWAVVNAVYMALLGPPGFAEIGDDDLRPTAHYAARRTGRASPASGCAGPAFFKEFVVDFTATGRTVAQINAALRERGIFGGKDLSHRLPRTRPGRAVLRHRGAHRRRHRRPLSTALTGGDCA